MKPKINNPEEYNKQLDELAKEAMKCILNGVYSHPVILAQLGDVATTNKRTLDQEVAERSYIIAKTMMKTKLEYSMK